MDDGERKDVAKATCKRGLRSKYQCGRQKQGARPKRPSGSVDRRRGSGRRRREEPEGSQQRAAQDEMRRRLAQNREPACKSAVALTNSPGQAPGESTTDRRPCKIIGVYPGQRSRGDRRDEGTQIVVVPSQPHISPVRTRAVT